MAEEIEETQQEEGTGSVEVQAEASVSIRVFRNDGRIEDLGTVNATKQGVENG